MPLVGTAYDRHGVWNRVAIALPTLQRFTFSQSGKNEQHRKSYIAC
jgi:hypothetical protein